MVKKFISTILSIAITVGGFGFCFADAPVQPTVEGLSVEEANEKINAYNEEVKAYNENADAEYEAAVEAVNSHNQAEDEKVAANQAEIDAYQKVEERIEKDAQKGITENRVYSGEDIPTTWETTVTTGAAITIKVEEAVEKALESYKVINLHIYLDGEESQDYYGTDVHDEYFTIDDDILDHVVLAEWETMEVDANDVVTTISEAESMGYKSAAFYRYLPGYTKGYWMPMSTEFASLCINSENTWYKGVAQMFSYDMGAYYGNIKNVFSMYTYGFTRTGEEPVAPVPYSPEYLESPAKQAHLDYMELIQATPDEPPADNPIDEPEQPKEPENPVTPPANEPEEPAVPAEPAEEPETPPVVEPTVEEPEGPAPADVPEDKPTRKPKDIPTENPVEEPVDEPEIIEVPEEIEEEETPLAEFVIDEPAVEDVNEPVPAKPVVKSAMQIAVTETEEEPTLEAAPVEEEVIDEAETPLVTPPAEDKPAGQVWALVNLITMIMTALALLKLDSRKYNIFNIILAVGSILLFVFTENTQNPMVLVDRWTILMVIIYILMVISRLVSPKEDEEEEEVE